MTCYFAIPCGSYSGSEVVYVFCAHSVPLPRGQAALPCLPLRLLFLPQAGQAGKPDQCPMRFCALPPSLGSGVPEQRAPVVLGPPGACMLRWRHNGWAEHPRCRGLDPLLLSALPITTAVLPTFLSFERKCCGFWFVCCFVLRQELTVALAALKLTDPCASSSSSS